MNKSYMFSAVFFSFCLLSTIAITTAGFIEVSEELSIIGNGTIDRDFAVQSAPDYTGQKLSETILPLYSPHGNFTPSTYRSNFELIMSNNSSIYYISDSDLPSAKHYLENQNYKLGVCIGFYYMGSQKKSFSFESSPFLSDALVISEAEGRSVVRARVVNESFTHYPTVDMRTWLEGNYSLDLNFLVLDVEYPEAGDDDWLVCPNSP